MMAEQAIARDGQSVRNPHDWRNIRAAIQSIGSGISRDGEQGFHARCALAINSSKHRNIIIRAAAVMAHELEIRLNDEELSALGEAQVAQKSEQQRAAQTAHDIHVDMADLSYQVTPQGPALEAKGPIRHTGDRFEEEQLQKGVDKDEAFLRSAYVTIVLSRIGKWMRRFNPANNNPVDFLDYAVSRAIVYTNSHDRTPEKNSLNVDQVNFIEQWADEVKTDFMHAASLEKINETKAIIRDVSEELSLPGNNGYRHREAARRSDRKDANKDTLNDQDPDKPRASYMRFFRDAEPATGNAKNRTLYALRTIFNDLADGLEQRHDIAKYLAAHLSTCDAYLNSDEKTQQLAFHGLHEIYRRLGLEMPFMSGPVDHDLELKPKPQKKRAFFPAKPANEWASEQAGFAPIASEGSFR